MHHGGRGGCRKPGPSVATAQAERVLSRTFQTGLTRCDHGSTTSYGRRICPSFQIEDLRRFRRDADSLWILSLAGTQANDQVFAELANFPKLARLDLSRTAITDKGLLDSKLFYTATNQPNLSLADTRISWSAIRELTDHARLGKLDLSGLGLTDDQIAHPIQATQLKLSRNPITDEGVSKLLSHGHSFVWM